MKSVLWENWVEWKYNRKLKKLNNLKEFTPPLWQFQPSLSELHSKHPILLLPTIVVLISCVLPENGREFNQDTRTALCDGSNNKWLAAEEYGVFEAEFVQ